MSFFFKLHTRVAGCCTSSATNAIMLKILKKKKPRKGQVFFGIWKSKADHHETAIKRLIRLKSENADKFFHYRLCFFKFIAIEFQCGKSVI